MPTLSAYKIRSESSLGNTKFIAPGVSPSITSSISANSSGMIIKGNETNGGAISVYSSSSMVANFTDSEIALNRNVVINGNLSANSLYFTSTTAIELNVSGTNLNVEGSMSVTGQSLFYTTASADFENIIIQSIYDENLDPSVRFASIKFSLPDDVNDGSNRRAYIGYGYSTYTSANAFMQKLYRGFGINATFGDINIGTESPYDINFLTNNNIFPKLSIKSTNNISISANTFITGGLTATSVSALTISANSFTTSTLFTSSITAQSISAISISANSITSRGNFAVSGNIIFPTLSAGFSSHGIIYKGTVPFLHSYQGVSGGYGGNTFLGAGAGNLTMNGTGNVWDAGANIGLGGGALNALTVGYQNAAIGYNALNLMTSGNDTVAIGAFALSKAINSGKNVALGSRAGQFNTGSFNLFLSTDAGMGVNGAAANSYNVCVGYQAGYVLGNNANYNILIGNTAGSTLSSGTGNIIFGIINTSSASANSELNIGNVIVGKIRGSSSIGIGMSPTLVGARLHLPAGTTSASSAPLKFNVGPTLTTTEPGSMEMTNDNFYLTQNTGFRSSIPGILYTKTATTTAFAASSTVQNLAASGIGNLILPANFFKPGKSIRITAKGVYTFSTTISLINQLKLNSITAIATPSITMPNETNRYWEFEGIINCYTTGAIGNFQCSGKFGHDSGVGTTVTYFPMFNVNSITADTTTANTISYISKFAGTGDPGETQICSIFIAESLN